MSKPEYDSLVIGGDPAGHKGTIAAAKACKRVHTGAIPRKTVGEAIFQLGGLAVSAQGARCFRIPRASRAAVAVPAASAASASVSTMMAQTLRRG